MVSEADRRVMRPLVKLVSAMLEARSCLILCRRFDCYYWLVDGVGYCSLLSEPELLDC